MIYIDSGTLNFLSFYFTVSPRYLCTSSLRCENWQVFSAVCLERVPVLTQQYSSDAQKKWGENSHFCTVAERLCFHRRLWFCSQGEGDVYPSMHWVRHPPPPPDGHCSGRYASYWNALLFHVVGADLYFVLLFRIYSAYCMTFHVVRCCLEIQYGFIYKAKIFFDLCRCSV